ncbi:MAG: PorV/PorQ family protein [candidate division WOR-3 bacterium]|nr:PorV/PorQ family protein [candidate division WOR-3 bacterium]
MELKAHSIKIIILFFIAIRIAHAGPGDAAAAFLRIPVDARIIGMGEAGVALVDNATALYYNAAGLSRIEKINLLFMHNEWLLGMNHEYFACGFNIQNIGTFGLAFNYVGSGSIQGITIRGDTIPGYYFSATDWSVSSGYGMRLKNIQVGFAFKFLSEKNESLSTGGFGIDIGMVHEPPVKGLGLGLSLSNLGTSIKLDRESFPLPMIMRAGWKYTIKEFNFVNDLIVSNGDNLGFGLGFEYWFRQILALRTGYRSGPDYDGLSGLRAGLGILINRLGIDYGVAPYGRLGITHRFMLSWNFQ